MKYALLVYSDQSAWEELSDEEKTQRREESMPSWLASFDAIAKSDPNWTGRELTAAATAKTVRIRDGQTIVTDGPFAETKELVGGAFFVDLPDLDEAIRVAALIPAAAHGSMEIRPIVTG
jgi:hypothetical protein